MVRVPWRRGPSPAEADRLLAVAEETAARHGPGPAATQAAARAVDAARRLAVHGARADRGRLLRALGRMSVNLALGRTPDDARPVVEESVLLARSLIADADDGFDDHVHADAVVQLAQAGQIVTTAGDLAHGRELAREAWAAVRDRRITGPFGRGARAEALSGLVQILVDSAPQIASADRAAAGTMTLAVLLVDVQRAAAVEEGGGPALDRLAEALSLLGRAALAVDRPDLTDAAWSEELVLRRHHGPRERAERTSGILADLRRTHMVTGEADRSTDTGPGAWRHASSYADRWRGVVPPDALEGLELRLAQAIALSRGGARLAEAEPLLDTLVADATALESATQGTPAHAGHERVLARALWRLAQVRHAAGRPESALEPARLSVAFATQHGDGLADTLTYLCDAGEIAFAAGHPEERIALLTEAIARGSAAPRSDAVRRGLGTALHNLATARTVTLSQDPPDAGLLAETVALAARAREIRAALATPTDPMTVWEYAQTLLLSVDVTMLARRRPDAVTHLSELLPLLDRLGPPAAELTRRAARQARSLQLGARS
ncbi:hypothetical protein [Catenuloplanes japonicus]|uniref:hypothetical protein n=1 Tax=Catenuloplanes japonicus TaxID=33876 RepID=UPI0012FBB287|nr:hypothetical protein [Catenuloplanes japonicus]